MASTSPCEMNEISCSVTPLVAFFVRPPPTLRFANDAARMSLNALRGEAVAPIDARSASDVASIGQKRTGRLV